MDKTGLAWADRNKESKGGKKYTYLEKSYDDEEDEDQDDSKNDDSVQSKLPLPTQRLIELIFVSVLRLHAGFTAARTQLRTRLSHARSSSPLLEHSYSSEFRNTNRKYRTRITSMRHLRT